MKLVRYGAPGAEKPGVMDAGILRDLSGEIADISSFVLSDAGLDALRALDLARLPEVPGTPRLGPPVAGIGKLVCIGLNFSDHAEELGLSAPEHPTVFMKATSAIIGAEDDVILPRGAKRGDWEIELGVVIGQRAKYVSEADALGHVAGFCIGNDVSERDLQFEMSGQWTKGKSCDTFAPLGPWLVTRDEVGDPQKLDMWLDVNGTRMQTGTSATMIFSIAQIVAHLSTLFTLHPGDVILTGTPPGVGMGQKPDPIYLRAGDVIELGITGLGRQRLNVRADPG